MKKNKTILTTVTIAFVAAICGVDQLRDFSAVYSSLSLNDVEALSECESKDGYVISNCQTSKGSTCYDPSGEFKATDCTYILVIV